MYLPAHFNSENLFYDEFGKDDGKRLVWNCPHHPVFCIDVLCLFWVFHPTNKHSIEGHRYHLLTHDKDEPI
ncbi:hypothetical protein A9E74_02809 [Methylophaga muralis]|uniref:Uncharacterized protein n=1 Tax=Methylophaga muralis TaxID=291169 RepID=A0A1E3GMV7_9GAMM|nr:hypothetical protein A9E74_02809 [Methylophaga muralis]